MQKNVQQIRDISVIEKELHACPVGLLALYIEDEKIFQVPTTFLYLDKNIYFFIEEASDLYEAIKFNTPVSFAIIKNETPRKSAKNENVVYHSVFIKIAGSIKIIEEQKIFDEVKQNYLTKYTRSGIDNGNSFANSRAFMIDTEEIQAVEETGE